ncbi:hypothetical protein ACIPEN_22170 [Herbaspirillum chlorophenolicum]|uniref:Uncharacterized protein n=1 Tax=Herbaspirillum chlorophenolicum TaxID=211589 RepID=A0ABW8F5G9_9BURK
MSTAYDRLIASLVRDGKEHSRALPSKYYGRRGDPANHVEFESEVQRREAAKQKRKGKKR